ncbi:MAG: argininosuccinate synthase [Hadesarchaea archaeon YNP_N21]|nr:MAG: argininosuccinate synthase [Hadesarchaea archaeon YNP_N21]
MRVALAYSGGLDTSVAIRLLQEKYNAEVITVTVDVGQKKEDLKIAEEKSKMLGAIKHYYIDARREFVEEYVFRSIKANGLYEGYPLSIALARYPIASKLVEVAKKEGLEAVAHGCTGKGNDQFRFDTTIAIKGPHLKIIAPVRELNLDRKWEIQYAKEHGIPIPVDVDKPYSTDENLWGRSIEGGILENPWVPPPEHIYTLTRSPKEAPQEPRVIEIEFERGVPVAIDGRRMDGVSLIVELNKVAGEHGVGRIDMIEDRVLGLKAREIYEAPAAVVLIQAHKALEQLVLTREELVLKEIIDAKWAELAYRGLWFDPLREDLDAFIDATQKRVSGMVKIELNRGLSKVMARSSPFSLYDEELVSFERFGFDQRESTGMIKFQALQGKIVRKKLGET